MDPKLLEVSRFSLPVGSTKRNQSQCEVRFTLAGKKKKKVKVNMHWTWNVSKKPDAFSHHFSEICESNTIHRRGTLRMQKRKTSTTILLRYRFA